MKKIIMGVLIMVILVAGCTTTETTQTTGAAQGTLNFDVSSDGADDIVAGDGAEMELSIENMFSNDLSNVYVTLEPATTGIYYEVTGPEELSANSTENWDIEISTSPGLSSRTYNLYPVVCFEYTQKYIGYFRVADGTPTELLDTSLSDNGPLDINVAGLKSVNINEETDDKLDVTVSFDLKDNIAGGQGMYDELDELLFISGDFRLDTVGGALQLTTTEGGAQNKMNTDVNNNCPLQTSGDNAGYALCYFTQNADWDAGEEFRFDVELGELNGGEIESSLVATLTYDYCFKGIGTSTSITVVEDN